MHLSQPSMKKSFPFLGVFFVSESDPLLVSTHKEELLHVVLHTYMCPCISHTTVTSHQLNIINACTHNIWLHPSVCNCHVNARLHWSWGVARLSLAYDSRIIDSRCDASYCMHIFIHTPFPNTAVAASIVFSGHIYQESRHQIHFLSALVCGTFFKLDPFKRDRSLQREC